MAKKHATATLFVGDLGAQAIAWSPTGTRLAVAELESALTLWQPVRAGQHRTPLARLEVFNGYGFRAAFSADGQGLAFGTNGQESALRLYRRVPAR